MVFKAVKNVSTHIFTFCYELAAVFSWYSFGTCERREKRTCHLFPFLQKMLTCP